MKGHEEKEKQSALVVIVGEVTDAEIAQRMDKHARNVAIRIISPKSVYREIPTRHISANLNSYQMTIPS